MLKTRLLSASALVTAAVLAAPGVAFAQTGPEPATSPTPIPTTDAPAGEDTGEVTVTGSRIRSPNAVSDIPITSIRGDAFVEQARNSIGDALNDLPQLASTFAQQNPGAGVGIAGLNLLDLRGLGTVRTLVLVNGRRHVGGDILNNATSVDVNTIPAILIDSVDIITGGSSAVYGSDAIAGVVNFNLRKSFDGFEVRGNVGVAEEGFGGNQTISAIAGNNFKDGRGNVTVAAEYSRADRVFASQIPWLRSVDGFVVTDIDPAGLTQGSDGFPDRTFFRDIRSSQSTVSGTIPINQRPSTAACGTGIGSTNGAPGTTGGSPYNCNYIFSDDGRLLFQTGTKVGNSISATYIGGNGQTGRQGGLTSVLPLNERYNFNALGHYEFSPALDVFVEGKWSRTTSQGNAAGPSFFTGAANQFDTRERLRLDNPYLDPADRTTLANLILASNCNPSFTVACPETTNIGTTAAPNLIPGNLTAAQRTAIANGSYRVVLGKTLLDVGLRDELAKRTTWRVVGGIRGTFLDDWGYEISGNYGKMTQTIDKSGYPDKQRFVLSIDAGRNPVTGAIQCRSQFDPASATPYGTTAFNASRLAADIAACVPYNPLGNTANNAAAIAYFSYPGRDRAQMEQLDINGFVSGNSGRWFNLPGGPVSFVIGGEYRSEKNSYNQDDFMEGGFTNSLAGLSFAPPAFKVKEAYGELEIPLLKDIPFIEELSLKGAGRVSDYNSSAGTVWTYNYGGSWKPVRDVRFRANYGRSVRAPNTSETGGSLVPNFFNQFQDPCRAANIGSGSQFRAANCAADLGALLNTPTFAQQAVYSLPVLSGSNPNLAAEKANSLTIGSVITPRWIPGLTISADYYNIRVKGVITSVSAQQIADGCYDAPTLTNPFCSLFTRYRGSVQGPLGELPGQIQGNTLIQAPLNFAKRIRKGIDTQLSYRIGVGPDVNLSTNVVYTHVFKSSNYANPTDTGFEDRLLSELGSPKNEFVWDVDVGYREFTLGYRMHYLSPMYLNTYEDFNSLQGRPPQNSDYAPIETYEATFYHNLRFQWDLKDLGGFGKSFQLFGGVDNVLDTHPPLGQAGTGVGSAIYDFRGRSFYAGFRAGF